jgi:hypothetical protein
MADFKLMYIDPDKCVSWEEMGLSQSGEIFIEKTHGKKTAEIIDRAWKKSWEGITDG